ncbi:hypothetical protein FRB96_007638 [Tulasnella sp. 330]|nr:hypothetical protein FRB96_007638 [Tulasnella sp. 330]KAG8868700.1 hypothetical protein FRB97_002067 [Tulasnella sp. 331]
MSFKILVGSYTTFITALSFTISSTGVGQLSVLSKSPAGTNPSWIAANPTNTSIVYAGQENNAGQLLSFVLNPSTGVLTKESSISTGGSDPAYFLPLASGSEIVVPNYGSATVADIRLGKGDLVFPSTYSSLLTLQGSGPITDRQASPHPHEVLEYITGQEILVPDLGSDKVWRLSRTATNAWQVGGFVQQPAGSGPRHIAVAGGYLYTLHEISNTLTQQTLPPLTSGIQPTTVTTVSIIPAGADNSTLAAAELMLSPLNAAFPTRYLYATNRFDPNPLGDSIAIFSLNPLRLVKQVYTGLNQLRGAAIGGPNGEYLVAGGLVGGGVSVFQRTRGGADLVKLANLPSIHNSSSFVFF